MGESVYHNLDAHAIVEFNCELCKSGDALIEKSWSDAKSFLPFHGFTRESVKNIDLRRIFSMITLNYIFVRVQADLKIHLMDGTNLDDGVFITRESKHNQRRFTMMVNFRVFDKKTCKPVNKYVTAIIKIHENPSPWIVACRFDEWER